jgi:UPF0716 protein FxsA
MRCAAVAFDVMLALLFLIIWPAAELFVVIKVADAIGVLETILLLVLSFPLGVWAIRTQGAAAWRRLTIAVSEQRTPTREVLDGVLVLLGGLLLIVPGFITDALGILLLLPPTRILARKLLGRNLQSRVVTRTVGFANRSRPFDAEATATDVDQPQLGP